MRVPVVCFAAGFWLFAAAPTAAQFSLEPDWARRPDQGALSNRYPKLPLMLEIEGRVMLACDVTATGGLTSCFVAEEGPENFGFGETAKRMAATFQMRPGIAVSRTTPHGTVRIPINFVLPHLQPAPPPRELSPEAKALAARLAAAADPLRTVSERFATSTGDLERRHVPGTTPAARAEAAAALRAAHTARLPEGRLTIAETIAAGMSETDLTGVVAFVETPLGRRWFGDEPALQDRLKAAWEERGRRFRADARAAFCTALDCAAREDTGLKPATLPRPGDPAALDPDAPLAYAPWQRRPDAAEIVRGWPPSYLFGLDGYARAVCLINALGAPDECDVVYETPGGMGVADALLRLADGYRVTPEFLATGVGRKVFLYAVFPGGPATSTTPEPPNTAPRARQALAERLVTAQEAETPPLENDPDFGTLLEQVKGLDPKTRAAAERALREAAVKGRADFAATRVRLIAEAFDEESLRRLIRFEEGPGRSLRRAQRAAMVDLAVLGMHWDAKVAADARATFCKARDCAPPPALANHPRPSALVPAAR